MRPGEPEPIPKEVGEGHPDIGFGAERDPVGANRDQGPIDHWDA
jgi:hypothetical protein